MLGILRILRGTHNALLFACIFLLICSFERLSRYDFAQNQDTSSPPGDVEQLLPGAEQPTSGEDHFVFWAGISAWERTVEQGLFHNRFLSNFWNSGGILSDPIVSDGGGAATDMITSSLSNKIFNYQDLVRTNAHASSTPSLVEAKLALRRQMRHSHKKKAPSNITQNKRPLQPTLERSDTPVKSAVMNVEAPNKLPRTITSPTIGFILHLATCHRESIARWQTVWKEQLIVEQQPFLFHILMAPTVNETCVLELQSDLQQANESIVYQVSQNKGMAVTLQTCQGQDDLLSTLQLEEVVYYDESKAQGRLRSSASMRLFRKHDVAAAAAGIERQPSFSSFQCPGGGQKPAFCDRSVMDCPWFQYTPRVSTLDNGGTSKDLTPELPGLEATIS